MSIPTGEGWIGALVTGLLAAAGGLLMLRRRLSGDNKEIARDRADTNLISRLERRADEADAHARAAEAKVTELSAALREAQAEIRYLRANLDRVIADMRRRTRGLPDEVRRIVETDFADFDDRPQRPPTPPAEKK